ncbi:hypothetical protein WN55_03358 [Dufourea novaeangliae]|uniref:Uncharacterized protein n=2 Tax=Dufourea novaeangliae TaxID=178035 RepID=A0A154PL58_DUFNO|nr:hypothetical protein WN55_03358 [Dufourea novaeangliae]
MQVATLFRESATLLGASSLDPPQTHHHQAIQQHQQQQQQQIQQHPADLHLAHQMHHHYKM